jgi:GNAT superfamily N-acetyltransferase
MITYRSIDLDEIGAALSLWNESCPLDPLNEAVLTEKIFGDESVPFEQRIVASSEGQLVGIAIGANRSTKPTYGCLKLFAVHPDYRRQGIGTAMVRRIQAQLRENQRSGMRIGESPPNYLQPGIDKRLSDAIGFAEARGFRAFAETCNMTVDLKQAPLDASTRELVLMRQEIRFRRARTSDKSATMAFVNTVFPAWKGELEATFLNRPISLHIAVSYSESGGERIVAFSAYDANNVGTGWFGPMGTAPEYRGKGIGEVLLKHCLADILNTGLAEAIIPWVGPVPFYAGAVGAVVARTFVRMEKLI